MALWKGITHILQNIQNIALLRRLTTYMLRRICLYVPLEWSMAKAKKLDPKSEALARDGVLNPDPGAVRDILFTANPFFDAKDLVQARYEMVRRHRIDGIAISEAAAAFGVTRPTFYKAQSALKTGGLAGLLPSRRGPKAGHKVTGHVIVFATKLKADKPEMTTSQCLDAIESRFGIKVHRRSLERALARKKKRIQPA